MQFDKIPQYKNIYSSYVFDIIRNGIKIESSRLNIKDNENKKNQALIDCFNIIGTQNPVIWIGVQKEHIGSSAHREDIYFYLNDDQRTRIYYAEAKRLPKTTSLEDEEYVNGLSKTGNPSGGIERFVLGIHGNPKSMNNYGMIAYIENRTLSEWLVSVNESIMKNYPNDKGVLKAINANEFLSEHSFNCEIKEKFTINHFWIDLTATQVSPL